MSVTGEPDRGVLWPPSVAMHDARGLAAYRGHPCRIHWPTRASMQETWVT